MHQRVLQVLAVAFVVATAGCLGSLASTSNDATPALAGSDGVATNSIDVRSTASVTAAPDLVVVHVAVVGEGDTAEAAARATAADADGLRAALDDVVDRDGQAVDVTLENAGYHLSPRYDYSRESREIVGYQATQSFRVETTAVDAAGAVVDAVVDGGASRVHGVTFTLSDAARADLRSDALAAAMESARADADVLAAAAGVTIDGLAGASTTNVDATPYYRGYAEDAGADGAATTFEPGDVTVTATVTVAYTYE
ncbi:SIMPL domain-containing protein [Halorubellus salinus]|uniref:SIMPL domain-containing protein n=1 Tax=Halorubellus salinus TaxID=755309 RepID=UPI001D094A80|nr:SIMPL domain-containing protein [Halorubellus salinus]